MGTFYIEARVENHDRQRSATVPQLLVDTGSEYTWVEGGLLEQIGIRREKKDLTFVMANGQNVTRSVGFAIIHVAGGLTTDEVVFAQQGDLQLLGARSLEGLNLRVDSQRKKLVAAGPIPAATAIVPGNRPKRGRPVVRLEGNNVEAGKKTLAESGLAVISGSDIADAAEKIVAAVKAA